MTIDRSNGSASELGFAAVPHRVIDGDEPRRIGDVAEEFDVTLRALRFYEGKGLINPAREGVNRLYSRSDRVRLYLILLGRRVGFSLREVKQMLDLYERDGDNYRQFKVTLERCEKQRVQLDRQRGELDEAIAELDQAIDVVRGKLSQIGKS